MVNIWRLHCSKKTDFEILRDLKEKYSRRAFLLSMFQRREIKHIHTDACVHEITRKKIGGWKNDFFWRSWDVGEWMKIMCVCVCMHILVCMCVCIHMCVHVCVHVHIHSVCICLCVCMCIFTYGCVCVFVCVCIPVCKYVYLGLKYLSFGGCSPVYVLVQGLSLAWNSLIG